ncbi:MAG: GNAT family N-acetyltransferase [Acidiferrobacteraceae bacterium]|nr:GNAT family N-acetyltransferase [Acidiferrobacteraceae bacterium]
MEGAYCRLTLLNPKAHAADLFDAFAEDTDNVDWVYLPYGPFDSLPALKAWLAEIAGQSDPLFYTVMDRQGKAVGVASYLRITPASGSIEVGHIHFSPRLQATPAATEAMYLMMKHAFTLGYRRYEWKCDALNQRSRRAALRLGLSFEGVFRQATVYKGRNRDTAWYAAVDLEWPRLRAAFEAWLDPANFDDSGQQQQSLSELTASILAASG